MLRLWSETAFNRGALSRRRDGADAQHPDQYALRLACRRPRAVSLRRGLHHRNAPKREGRGIAPRPLGGWSSLLNPAQSRSSATKDTRTRSPTSRFATSPGQVVRLTRPSLVSRTSHPLSYSTVATLPSMIASEVIADCAAAQ